MRYDLCGACAAKLAEAYELRKVEQPADNKITCAHCRKRRYGAKYELMTRKEDDNETNPV